MLLFYVVAKGMTFFYPISSATYSASIEIRLTMLNDHRHSAIATDQRRAQFKMVKSCPSKGDGKMRRECTENEKKNPIKNLVMMSDLTLFHVKLTFIATR